MIFSRESCGFNLNLKNYYDSKRTDVVRLFYVIEIYVLIYYFDNFNRLDFRNMR